VNRDDIAVLNPQVVTDNAVEAGAAVIEIIVGENDENGILSLLSSYENCVATEELESLHGVIGERDNGVVIVDGIGNPGPVSFPVRSPEIPHTHISWLGFFFFLRMAVAVSPSSLRSAPEGSLKKRLADVRPATRALAKQTRAPPTIATYVKLTFFLWSCSALGSPAILSV
jgi:hypothetical protein